MRFLSGLPGVGKGLHSGGLSFQIFLQTGVLFQDPLSLGLFEGIHPGRGVRIGDSDDPQSKEGCIDRAAAPRSDCRHGNPAGHLHGRKEGIHPIHWGIVERDSDDWKSRVGRDHSRQVSCATGGADEDANPPAPGLAREGGGFFRSSVGGEDPNNGVLPVFPKGRGAWFEALPIGIGSHQDCYT